MGQNLSRRDEVLAITKSNFGDEMLLVNLDVIGYLDHTCMHNIPQTRSPNNQSKKKEEKSTKPSLG